MNKLNFISPPIVALLLLGIAFAIHRSFPNLEILPATAGGFAWLGAGLTLSASAAWQFRQVKTTVLPLGTPQQLVTLGAYLWTRNPMYLGLLTALIGFALYMGTLPFWLVPAAFFLVINRFHIPYEEARLTDVFGADYSRYQKRVNRWI
ncbi:MAG: isoprenylcysteine carboxylmethyltransferase family protein [Methylococcaceae bacterium]|nr:isoprenylcysteine carboxylmethyltransferase family protein [Methylococcaceae bacterium]